jgi:hypothetical protein
LTVLQKKQEEKKKNREEQKDKKGVSEKLIDLELFKKK